MRTLTTDNLADYLRAAQWADPKSVEWLSGGVSNAVFRVAQRSAWAPAFVVKQSREQLRTQADWFSRLDRIWREADAMEVLHPLLPPHAVPRVLFQDQPNYLFAMEAIDRAHIVWKSELLTGVADRSVAVAAADILAGIHGATLGRDDLRTRFGDCEVFDQLRLDPFYRFVADRQPDVRPALQRLIDRTLARSECVVHADFSPKNLLIVRDGSGSPRVTLVDYETVHFGDPAFDLGFFFTHLLLKAMRQRTLLSRRSGDPSGDSPELVLATAFLDRYESSLREAVFAGGGEEWSPDPVQAASHLGGCLLARIDGKSPVDYLPDAGSRDDVRRFARTLLLDGSTPLRDAIATFRDAL